MVSIDLTAKSVVIACIAAGLDPAAEITAAAGPDYGTVRAYPILGSGRYAIECSDSASTEHYLVDTVEDLGDWLIPDNLDDLDAIVRQAEVYGADYLDTPESGECYVLVTRHYYDGSDIPQLHTDGDAGWPQVVVFDSPAAAQAWIDEHWEVNLTGHGEHSLPSYRIVA